MTNPPSETWGDFAHRLITDTAIVGLVGWLGTIIGIVSLIVTVAGFTISIIQIRRVKRSSEAARTAVLETTKVVKSKEQSSKLSGSLFNLKYGTMFINQENATAAAAYLEMAATFLIDARQLSQIEADQTIMTNHIVAIRRITQDIMHQKTEVLPTTKARNFNGEIRKAVGELEEIAARLHYDFSDAGAIQ